MHVKLATLLTALARPSYVASVYDRAITVFSPDGNLMQVSYAEQAVQRGGLAVAACNGRDAIVLCLGRPADSEEGGPDPASKGNNLQDINSSKDVEEPSANAEEENGAKSDDESERGQQRHMRHEVSTDIEVVGSGIPDATNNQDRKLCEVDEGIHLAFAGISADGRVLASKIRLECQSYRYRMGTPPGVGYIARYVGDLQHRYTCTGGARPFGVSCLIAGFDEDACPRIFRSEPSGAFAEWTASAIGKGSDKALDKLEAVQDLGALDWRGVANEAVRATLAGGGRKCDVMVLRRETEETTDGGHLTEIAAGSRKGWRRRGNAWTRRFSGSLVEDGRAVLEGLGEPGQTTEGCEERCDIVVL